ncbi:Lrp/AsnC family transcriptional regulator [Sphingomonas jaspsi]|uniref:Lrp/AsnC family transcriptional regulator n=1 Tax=Sphingomonas jaspsi TaxID=392409 RepID=UPI0004B88312|nr:Lrp/AsnC family transcriptional regulator [Sphingomonas jaspsi]
MDRTDHKILEILQQDASLPVSEIAERVNLSQTPCWRRIQKMEKDGIIQRRVAIVDPDKLGLGLTFFVEIESRDHSREWSDQFIAFTTALPQVMDVYRMAGDVDYLLRVVVGSTGEFDKFYQRLIGSVALKNVTSRFAMERIKVSTAYSLLHI